MPDKPGEKPKVLSPQTWRRLDDAAKFVEAEVRTRAPRPNLGRSQGLAPHAWGLLQPGGTITARSGLTLGEGDVTLLLPGEEPYGADLAEYEPYADPYYGDPETVHVYNPGVEINADSYSDGLPIPLHWINGYWVLDVSIGSATAAIALTRDAGITAASASGSDITPGTGTVDTYTLINGPPLVLSLLGSAITAYNMVNVAIPGNTPVFLSYWAGKPWVTVLPCDFTIVDPYYS